MSFELISDIYIDDINTMCRHYKHVSGLSLIHTECNDTSDVVDINISIRTPAVDNRGTSHIVEHCVASEININNMNMLYNNACTYQDKTCYEYSINKNNCETIGSILKKIFFPKYKGNKNIFLREGWRLEYKNKNYKVSGIAYDEIKESFTSPLYTIMSYIPYTLYGNSIYGNISGGLTENIIDLKFEDIIKYHDIYYTPENCCIYLHGDICIDSIFKIIESTLENIKNTKVNIIDLENRIQKLNSNITKQYPVAKEGRRNNFIGMNYAINKPKNQLEYNIYYALSTILTNSKDGILVSSIKKNKIGNIIQSTFKNSLYLPYFTIILSYCKKNISEIFQKLCTDGLMKAINILPEVDIPNYIYNDIYINEKIDSFNLGKYIMEAYFSNINPFSYIIPIKYNSNDIDIILEKLKKEFVETPMYSIIDIFPKVSVDRLENSELIEKAINNGVVNEYKVNITKNTNANTVENNVKKIIYKDIETNYIYIPEEREIEGIRYFLYKRSDSNVDIHLYFDIGFFNVEQISYAKIFSEYLNQFLYDNKIEDIKLSCEVFNDYEKRFIVRINSDEINAIRLLKIFIDLVNCPKIDTIWLKSRMEQSKYKYELKMNKNMIPFLQSRTGSYFSQREFYIDSWAGIGNYKFLCKNYNCLNYEEILNISNLIFSKDNIWISIYARDDKCMCEDVNEIIRNIKSINTLSNNTLKFNMKNEGFIIPSETNYMAQGYSITGLGYEDSEKYKIMCSIISNNYLIPTLRNEYNVYSSGLAKYGENIFFFSYRDPNIILSSKVFQETGNYILKNIKNIIKDYQLYKYNFFNKIKDCKFTPENDYSTAKKFSQNYFKTKQEIYQEIYNLTEDDVFKFYNILDDLIKKDCYLIVGNDKMINQYAKNLNYIEYLTQ